MICMREREREADFAVTLQPSSAFSTQLSRLIFFFSCTVSTSMYDMLGFLKTFDLDCNLQVVKYE